MLSREVKEAEGLSRMVWSPEKEQRTGGNLLLGWVQIKTGGTMSSRTSMATWSIGGWSVQHPPIYPHQDDSNGMRESPHPSSSCGVPHAGQTRSYGNSRALHNTYSYGTALKRSHQHRLGNPSVFQVWMTHLFALSLILIMCKHRGSWDFASPVLLSQSPSNSCHLRCFQGAKCCSECSMPKFLPDSHKNPLGEVSLLSSFYRWGNYVLEMLGDLLVIQTIGDRAQMLTQVIWRLHASL